MENLEPLLNGARRWLAIRGDAIAVLGRLPTGCVDSFVSDPPYGIDLELHTTTRRTRVLGDGRLEARRLWERFVPLAARAAKPNSAHLFFGTWRSPWMRDVLAEHFTIKHRLIWVKRHWGLGAHVRGRHEEMWLVHKGKPPVPARADCDVWEAARDSLTLHPCRKPVPLLRRALGTVLPVERRQDAPLVVDPFAGVFSTGVAAIEEGCRFLGVELDRRYHKLGVGRLENAEK